MVHDVIRSTWRPRRPRTLPRLIAALVLVIAATAPSTGVAQAADPVVLKVGLVEEPNTSNVNQCCMSSLALRLTYNGLAAMPFGGGLEPEYAESWTTSEDGLTWTFKIRPDMQWSDGEPADATDAAFTFNYLIDSIGDPNEVGQGYNTTFWWKDADGKSNIESATAPDPLTLIVKTRTPLGIFLYNNFFVLPEHIWKDVSYEEAMTTFQAEPPIVGSGPFILTEWVHGQSQRLVRNEHYWGGRPAIDEILVVYYQTQDAVVSALKAGEIDLAWGLPAAQLDTLAADASLETISAATTWYTYLALNTRGTAGGSSTDAGADPAFRDAISHAIDRQAIVDRVYNGNAQVGVGLVAPLDATYYTGMPDLIRPFDIELAKQKLDAAGYALGSDGARLDKAGKPLNLKLVVWPDADTVTAGQFVAEWLGQLGIEVTPVSLEIGAYFDIVYGNHEFDLDLGFRSPPGTPVVFVNVEAGSPDGWYPQEYADLYQKFAQETDPDAATAIGQELDRMFYEGAGTVVLAYRQDVQAHATGTFEGWTRTPAEIGPFLQTNAFSSIAPFFTGLTLASAASPEPSAGEATGPIASGSPQASPGPDAPASSSDSTSLIVGAIVLVAVVGGGALWLRGRRNK
jgi:peptide/nickel transport system substrate-binding protein